MCIVAELVLVVKKLRSVQCLRPQYLSLLHSQLKPERQLLAEITPGLRIYLAAAPIYKKLRGYSGDTSVLTRASRTPARCLGTRNDPPEVGMC